MIFALQLLPSSDGIPAQAREPYWEVSIPVFRERPETTRQVKTVAPTSEALQPDSFLSSLVLTIAVHRSLAFMLEGKIRP